MLGEIALDQILFLDIETASQEPEFSRLSEQMQALWQQKGGWAARRDGVDWDPDVAARIYEDKAAIYAEFGRIVVISVGYLFQSPEGLSMRLKSFANEDEAELLRQFSALLNKHYNDPNRQFICGHNLREFDVPYICRRLVINRLPLPDMINITGKKPWETQYLLDTMTYWKFGDMKNFTSLNLLANILGIPTPKDDIDGSEVGRVFWQEKDLARIAQYCEKDVITVAQVLLRYQGLDIIPAERLHSVAVPGNTEHEA